VLTLLLGDWPRCQHSASMFANMFIQHSPDLANADLFARNIQGDCALSLLADAARKIKTLPSQSTWQKEYNEKQMKLPQQLLQAWQAARTPTVRSVKQLALSGEAGAGSSAAG